MSKGTRYTDEFKAKAVRLLTESRPSYSSETKAIAEVARDPGVSSETLRRWRNQSDASAAEQSEQSAQEAMAELKRLRAENAELRRAAQAVPGRGRPGAGDVPMGLMVELETPPRQPGLQDTRAGRNRVLYEPGDTSRLTIKAEQKPDQFSRHPLSSCLNDNDAHSGSYGPSFTTLLIHARACTMPPVNAVTYRTAALLSSLIEPLSSPVEFDSGGTADDTRDTSCPATVIGNWASPPRQGAAHPHCCHAAVWWVPANTDQHGERAGTRYTEDIQRYKAEGNVMGFVNFIIELLKDPRAAIASWIAMGVAPTLGFIFLIVFIETGVVFFPFLPGDSLLFAAGFFAAPDATTGESALPLMALLPVVWCAPIIGDQCNYFIGHFFGRRIIESGKVKALTPERLSKTEAMIEKWGPLAVFLGRFFPFIRTFMPFISGISGMRWARFTPFSMLGGLCWSTLFTLLGYFFGGIPVVQENFELVIVAILVISLIPTIVGLLKAKFGKKQPAAE